MRHKTLLPGDLVALRKSLGMNQMQFWSRIGVTQSGGSRYESGRAMPKPVATLVRIAYTEQSAAIVKALRGNSR